MRSARSKIRLSCVTMMTARSSANATWRKRSMTRRPDRSEEHTSELPVTNAHLVCRLLLEKKKKKQNPLIRRTSHKETYKHDRTSNKHDSDQLHSLVTT